MSRRMRIRFNPRTIDLEQGDDLAAQLRAVDLDTLLSVLRDTDSDLGDSPNNCGQFPCNACSDSNGPRTNQESNEREECIIEELAKVLHERDRAVLLAIKAGFPVTVLPPFTTPEIFWTRVAREARNGALHGGLRPIVACAAELYPANKVFAQASLTPEARSLSP